MRPALIERLSSRPRRCARGVEIGLADLQVNDVAALRFECAGAHQYFKGGFHADAVHPLR